MPIIKKPVLVIPLNSEQEKATNLGTLLKEAFTVSATVGVLADQQKDAEALQGANIVADLHRIILRCALTPVFGNN